MRESALFCSVGVPGAWAQMRQGVGSQGRANSPDGPSRDSVAEAMGKARLGRLERESCSRRAHATYQHE